MKRGNRLNEEASRLPRHKSSLGKQFNDEVLSPVKKDHLKLNYGMSDDNTPNKASLYDGNDRDYPKSGVMRKEDLILEVIPPIGGGKPRGAVDIYGANKYHTLNNSP